MDARVLRIGAVIRGDRRLVVAQARVAQPRRPRRKPHVRTQRDNPTPAVGQTVPRAHIVRFEPVVGQHYARIIGGERTDRDQRCRRVIDRARER